MNELLDRYKYVGEKNSNEIVKLYVEVRKLSSHDTSLMTVRDHAKNALNLGVTTRIKVVEMRMKLNNNPTIDMIHLHRETGYIIYMDLLKETLQVLKLQSSKKRVEELLRKEKVENKFQQTQLKGSY